MNRFPVTRAQAYGQATTASAGANLTHMTAEDKNNHDGAGPTDGHELDALLGKAFD